ncbi:phosphinothricin acetyltransferase [Cellulomonas marina]|uniref:Phosphinothricin acetyltransferase n=2 Tax=Cellulomonas marina TaxID=988821 RepID=A0A1I0YEG0_9CELL|nr:GNAT family N-acetyltransferase [Cellulomonas marina]SFB11166.1 phosphinothricin acetyltransferase [Cellulomonas marina]
MTGTHAEGVLEVYAAGIASGHATFTASPPSWSEFDVGHRSDLRLVALGDDDEVLGWVAVAAVSSRPVYAGVVEESVYVAPRAARRGVGAALLGALVAAAPTAGVWTLQAGVFPENAGSLALHAACEFRVVGRRERLGLMTHGPLAGTWRDVLLLERRLGG